jgi:hypothetical protein
MSTNEKDLKKIIESVKDITIPELPVEEPKRAIEEHRETHVKVLAHSERELLKLPSDRLLDMYNDYITLYNLFEGEDLIYLLKAETILLALRLKQERREAG